MKKLLLLFAAMFMVAGFASAQDDALYTSTGETSSTEGWGTTFFPAVRDIKVEAYEDYFIVRGWAGVEGYDLMVEVGENDALVSVTPIVNGEESEMGTKGYFDIPTGREDFDHIQAYLATGYCYAGLYDGESGYLLMGCYIGSDWTYYYLAWPQDEEGSGETWVNPFEGEATYLYSATAKSGTIEEEDPTADDAWGTSVFPVVENIRVDVYDKYIYIHALGGVEGYDAKVAYNEAEEVPSIISIQNGVESEPCKSYAYLYTGREDYVTIQAYTGSYSNAATYEDKSGYVILGAYIYMADDSSDWNYYYISWADGKVEDGISTVQSGKAASTLYNMAGQRVNASYKGIVVCNGKKLLK